MKIIRKDLIMIEKLYVTKGEGKRRQITLPNNLSAGIYDVVFIPKFED